MARCETSKSGRISQRSAGNGTGALYRGMENDCKAAAETVSDLAGRAADTADYCYHDSEMLAVADSGRTDLVSRIYD